MHDFADPELAEYAKAIPYGVYDVFNNEGWVNVGDTADTAAFAVESIRRWWYQIGQVRFPEATRLLITADAGGSNGYRVRAWKVELAALAKETGLDITVCHYPPGTSKWNKIEHRLFSFITINWRGRPLTTMRTIIELISATSTSTGLSVLAEYDPNWYPKGVKITDRQLAALPLVPNDFHNHNGRAPPALRSLRRFATWCHRPSALAPFAERTPCQYPAWIHCRSLSVATSKPTIRRVQIRRRTRRPPPGWSAGKPGDWDRIAITEIGSIRVHSNT